VQDAHIEYCRKVVSFSEPQGSVTLFDTPHGGLRPLPAAALHSVSNLLLRQFAAQLSH